MIRILKNEQQRTKEWAYEHLAYLEYTIIIKDLLLFKDLQFINGEFTELFITIKKEKDYLNVIHKLFVSDLENAIVRIDEYYDSMKPGIKFYTTKINEESFYTDIFERAEKVENEDNITKYNIILKHIKIKKLNDTKEILVHKK